MFSLKFHGRWAAIILVLSLWLCRSAAAQYNPAMGTAEIVSPAAVEGLNVYGKSLLGVISQVVERTVEADADILNLLAQTQEIKSAKWENIKPRLVHARLLGAAGVLWFAQPDGTYYTIEKDRMAESLKDREYFPKLLSGETVMGSLVVSRSTGKKSIVIAAPVKNGAAIVGAIGASIFLDDLNQNISSSLPLPDGVYFYAISPDSTIVLHKSAGLIFAKAKELGSPTLNKAIDEMLRQDSGTVDYEFNGFAKRAFYQTIHLLDWKVALGVNLKKLKTGK